MNDLTTRPPTGGADELTVQQIVEQTQKIQDCIAKVMKEGEHYGVIPGTERSDGKSKPTLLKPGAEKLCLLFRLDPEYEVIRQITEPTLISYMVRCVVFHIPTGARIASGLGSCNSREEKYLRAAPKKCPKCNKETIFRSKGKDGDKVEPGWFCWSKKGGCGQNYLAADPEIVNQDAGIKDPADLDNTLIKMACKRALIAAVLNATAASDFFTQDLEDLTDKAAEYQTQKEGAGPKTDGKTTPTQTDGQTSAGKPPKANTIAHNGRLASPEQVRKLQDLKGKIGGMTADGYKKQLAAFKDKFGKPINTSTELSEDQIANLIGRYEAQIARQAAAAKMEPEMADAATSGEHRSDGDPGEKIGEEKVTAIRGLSKQLNVEELSGWLRASFGVDTIEELTDHQGDHAYTLLSAWGTALYDRILADMKAKGEVRS